MKKYTYLVNFDSQTLERVGESFAVKGDGGIAELEFAIPSNFGVPANQALWRVFFRLPGEKESLFETLPAVTATESGDYVTSWTISKAITQKAGRLAFSLAAISGNDIQWNSRTVIMQVPESQYQPESEEAEKPYTGRLDALEGSMAAIRGEFAEVQDDFEELKETATLGTPIPESLVANMTEGHVYIYTGTEPGYTAGHVYYYVGGALTDGGVYGGTAVDATLTQSGQAADAKKTGDEISQIKEDLSAQSLVTGGERLTFLTDKYYKFTSSSTRVSFEPTNYAGRNGAISPCVEGDIFLVTVHGAGAAAIGWAFADVNGSVLARSRTNVVANNLILTAPAGSAYAVFNETENSPIYYAVKLAKNTIKHYAGYASLNVLAIGDSICRGSRNSGKGFIGNVGCRYVNMGVGGATLTNTHDVSGSTDTVHPVGASDIPDQLVKYAASTDEAWYIEPDAIIAEGGTNDYTRAALGTVPTVPVKTDEEAAELDRSTIAGALGFLFWNMIKLYPLAHR